MIGHRSATLSRRAGALLTTTLALAMGSAHGAELVGTGPLAGASVQVTSDFEARFHHVDERVEGFEDRNIHDYVEQVERLNFLLSKGTLTVGLTVDQVGLYANRYILDGELYHSNDLYDETLASPFADALVVVEKAYLQKRVGDVELTLGDTYASFGRGMALNIVKNTDIDVDSSIRGAKAVIRSGPLDVSLVSGLSNTQEISQDFPNMALGRDVSHMVSGARVEHYGLGPFQAGVHGVVYAFGRPGDLGMPQAVRYEQSLDATVVGATVSLPGALGVDWFAEADLFTYRAPELTGGEERLQGHAIYGAASLYPGKTVVLVEAKQTKDTELLNAFVTNEGWELANVPTLEYERVITEDSAAAINSNDLTGVRVRVDHALVPAKLTPYVAVSVFRDEDLGGLHFNSSPENIAHAVTGLQWFEGRRVVQVNTGFRQDQREDADGGADKLAHLDAELHLPVGPHNALELAVGVKRFQWGNNDQQQADFTEMENAIAWHQGEKLMLLLFQDWTNNPLIRSEGNLADQLYGALEVHYARTSATKVRAFYGAYKAGIRCSGGQCRSLPGFEGGRLSYETVF